MAEALVGGSFLSAFLQVLFDRIASREVIDFFRGAKLDGGLLEKLEITLLSVSAVLEDAEEKEVTMAPVKAWLDKMKDAVYDAEQIMDEIATEALRCKLKAEFQTSASKVRHFISGSRNSFVKKIEPKIKEVLDRLEYLAKQKDLMGLKEGVGGKPSEKLPTTSLVEESGICGRDENKEAIIDLLLSDDTNGKKISVIAVVGMGGIGKTTLAQLVYNDERVREHFDVEAWVCVSEEFDLFKITKSILDAVTPSAPCDNKDLNWLQVTLREKLAGKKFLVVLDDVWNKKYADWELLSNPFESGALGSKVIVTTRDNDVASAMRASVSHQLKELSEADSWSLFTKHAFHDGNSVLHLRLQELGRQIVEKCKGLPLAIKTIGALLRSKLDIEEWDRILRSELWDLPVDETNILPALRLSYKYLPPPLKHCFAYCSIFPKDCIFSKEQVILLWMAEGFLQQFNNKTMGEVGEEYFCALVSRSLFQQSGEEGSDFGMHDLVNDLAKFVCGQFIFRLEVDLSHENINRTRHVSYIKGSGPSPKFEVLYEAKQLRTFLPLELSPHHNTYRYLPEKVQLDLLRIFRFARVLSLSRCSNVTELPESIGEIKHLRYLEVSYTPIKRLPHSICELYNLQTLKLSHCYDLTVLPRDMYKLVNLCHLDFAATPIKLMPVQMGRLKYLENLTQFIVGKQNGSRIEELGKLENLRGSLEISELQNVASPRDASNASMKDKRHLKKLVLGWNAAGTTISESQKSVLDCLQPHTNLEFLVITHYSGKSFPDWVGHHSFSNIANLSLFDCKYCCSLPPLWQLPSLQALYISGFDGVVVVGSEFYGNDSSSIKPFGALRSLTFAQMLNWEKWFPFGENEGGAFPKLGRLTLWDCPKLTGGLPINLPSLATLDIWSCSKLTGGLPINLPSLATLRISNCPQLVASLPKAPALRYVGLSHCSGVQLKELPNGMKELNMEGFDALESLPEEIVGYNSCLQELKIKNCSSLASFSFPRGGLHSSLGKLELIDCDSLRSVPLDFFPKLYNISIEGCRNLEYITVLEQHEDDGTMNFNSCLQELRIRGCSSLVSLPRGGLRSALKTLEIEDCMKIELPTPMDYSVLERLQLKSCDSIRSVPLDLLSRLSYISISGCTNLESLTVSEQNQRDLMTSTIRISHCPHFVSFPNGGLRAPNLTYLYIKNCGSLRSLPKKMHMLLPSLQDLCIIDCVAVETLPEGGLPSNLNSISIVRCGKLVVNRIGCGLQKLTFLTYLTMSGNVEALGSFPEVGLLPTGLTILRFGRFPNMQSLDKKGLERLTALEKLEIGHCPQLRFMPEDGLPASLSVLSIFDCPLLKKKWQRKRGKEWHKIAHVPNIYIDDDTLQGLREY